MNATHTVTAHRNTHTAGVVDYVAQLPGDGGKDYGYTRDPKKAKRLTVAQAKRFLAYCERVNASGFGTSP